LWYISKVLKQFQLLGAVVEGQSMMGREAELTNGRPMVTGRIALVFAPIVVGILLGNAIHILITVGLALGILRYLTGLEPIKGLAPIEGEPIMVCFGAAVVMSGAFPLIFLVSKLLRKPFEKLGNILGINSISAVGFMSSLATNATTFEMMNSMDKKGAMLNSAFAMAGAFTFAGHLAYTMARDTDYILPMIVGKLISGISSVLLAIIIYKRTEKKGINENEH
jgi:ethanolamine transporter